MSTREICDSRYLLPQVSHAPVHICPQFPGQTRKAGAVVPQGFDADRVERASLVAYSEDFEAGRLATKTASLPQSVLGREQGKQDWSQPRAPNPLEPVSFAPVLRRLTSLPG